MMKKYILVLLTVYAQSALSRPEEWWERKRDQEIKVTTGEVTINDAHWAKLYNVKISLTIPNTGFDDYSLIQAFLSRQVVTSITKRIPLDPTILALLSRYKFKNSNKAHIFVAVQSCHQRNPSQQG